MKKISILASVLWLGACTASLPLSQQGRTEADLMGDFLEVSFAQRETNESQFEALQKLLSREPESAYLKQLLVAQALADGEAEKATPYIDFIQNPEPSAEDWRVYAAYQIAMRDYKGALDSYEKVLKEDPDNEETMSVYVSLLAKTSPQKAVEKMEQLAKQNPLFASEIYTGIAILQADQQNFKQMHESLNKALAQDPQNARALWWRAQLYEKEQKYFLMLHDLEELDKLNMATEEEYNRMAAVYMLAYDFEKAEEALLKAYEKNPSHPQTCHFLAGLAEYNQDYEKAITYTRAAADYSATPGKWLQVSFYQKRLGRTKEMLDTLKEANRRFDGNVELGFFYGLALSDAKKYKEAAQVLQKVVQTSPDYEEARLYYAYALESLKKYNEMEKEVDTLLAANPANAPALNLLAYSLAQRGVRLDEAQEYIARALAVNPDDVSFLDTQAWVFIKQNKWEEADELLSSLTEEEITDNAEIAYHMGYLRWKQGRREEALRYLEKAKDQWPDAKKLYGQLSK